MIVIPLPLRGPVHKMASISALMHSTKACNPTYVIIFRLDRSIGSAHQTLSRQVDAVADIGWRRHNRGFATAMDWFAIGPGYEMSHIFKGFN